MINRTDSGARVVPDPVFTGPKVGAIALVGCVGITALVIGILMFLHVMHPMPAAMYSLTSIGAGILLADVIALIVLSTQYFKSREIPSLPAREQNAAANLPGVDRTPNTERALIDPSTSGKVSLVHCVPDTLKHIFSFLEIEEICKIATTCKTFSIHISQIHLSNAQELRRCIEYYGNLAQQLDLQILALTQGRHSLIENDPNPPDPDLVDTDLYQRFKFPLGHWKDFINQSKTVYLSCDSS